MYLLEVGDTEPVSPDRILLLYGDFGLFDIISLEYSLGEKMEVSTATLL